MITDCEINRQLRVLRQTLAIHSMLREDYSHRVLAIEIIILVASVIFCATVFAGDEFYRLFGISTSLAKGILGIASIASFCSSLVLLRVDWQGLAARHGDAVEKWSTTLQSFSENRNSDGTWPDDQKEQLSAAYWATFRSTISIPDKKFNRYKSRYLLKCEISALKSEYPGCPRLVLWGMIRVRDLWRAVRSDSVTQSHQVQKESRPHGDSTYDAG